jgi:hypothetical protein
MSSTPPCHLAAQLVEMAPTPASTASKTPASALRRYLSNEEGHQQDTRYRYLQQGHGHPETRSSTTSSNASRPKNLVGLSTIALLTAPTNKLIQNSSYTPRNRPRQRQQPHQTAAPSGQVSTPRDHRNPTAYVGTNSTPMPADADVNAAPSTGPTRHPFLYHGRAHVDVNAYPHPRAIDFE